MKKMTRREALLAAAAGSTALALSGSGWAASTSNRSRMGIVIYALGIHQASGWDGRHAGLAPAFALLEESHALGAAGIQCPLALKDKTDAAELRRQAERYDMFLEASLVPPRNEADRARFETEVQLAKEAGASVGRTVIMPGRRYEEFKSLTEFQRAEAAGLKSLQLAESIVARHRFRLAVENHKDQLVAEKIALLQRLSSEFIGLCVDVGNNLALVEDPVEVARALAPWAFTVHIKDHVVREYKEGFLLGDTALGEGFLDLPAIVEILRDAKPAIRFNFESITRDPLKVPVLTEDYWATLGAIPAPRFARHWRLIKTHAASEPLVTVSALGKVDQLRLERRNVARSLVYAREHLEL